MAVGGAAVIRESPCVRVLLRGSTSVWWGGVLTVLLHAGYINGDNTVKILLLLILSIHVVTWLDAHPPVDSYVSTFIQTVLQRWEVTLPTELHRE